MSDVTAAKSNELDDWFRHVGTQMSNEDYERGIQVIAAEHAEVERLCAELVDETKRADDNYDDVRKWRAKAHDTEKYLRVEREAARRTLARTERAEAELLRARAIPELLRHDNARLTAQLAEYRERDHD